MNNRILHFAFCFVCGDPERFVDTGINYVRCCDYSLLFWVMRAGSPWTSREIIFRKWAVLADHVMNSGHRNKLWSETAWTFVIPDGARPSFGFGDCCDVCTSSRKFLLCYNMNSWAEGKVWATDHPKFGSCFPCSCFHIYYILRRVLKINLFIKTLSHRKLCFRLGYRNFKVLLLNSWSQLAQKFLIKIIWRAFLLRDIIKTNLTFHWIKPL